MPPQKRASGRGRRDPELLSQEQSQFDETAGYDEQDQAGEQSDLLDDSMVLAYEGDSVRAGVSIPVTLAGMDRFSLVQSEAVAHTQEHETGLDTAARARALMRISFFESVDEMEENMAAYAELKAAEAAQVDRALAARRTGN